MEISIYRQDKTLYGVFDYLEYLKFRLDIIEGNLENVRPLYFKNENGGFDVIDDYGNSNTDPLKEELTLISKIVQAQLKKRIKKKEIK